MVPKKIKIKKINLIMSEILVRVSHPGGLIRITTNLNDSIESLLKKISEKTKISEDNIIISFDNKRFVKISGKSKLKYQREFEDGVRLFVKPLKKGEKITNDEKKIEKDDFLKKSLLQKKCNHGPMGKCLNCSPITEPPKTDITKPSEKPKKNKCNHGPNGKCINCIIIEKKDHIEKKSSKNCNHGPNTKCLNCLHQNQTNIKHLSFDEFIDRNYSKCKSHKKSQRCNNCLIDLEFDYKIKKTCLNHDPYPKGMCSKCLPPSIIMKQQKYRHVDYAQFMNFRETSALIKYWLKNINQRVGYLYGYYAEDPIYSKGVRGVIESIYEPPQENSFNQSIIMDDPFEVHVDMIMSALGLERIGWIFTTYNKDMFLSSFEMQQASRFQEKFKVSHPVGIDVSKQITVVLRADNDNGNIVKPEVYMVSDEMQSLVRDRLIDEPESRKFLRIKKPENSEFMTKFLLKGKLCEKVEPDFFIVNVAHGQSKHVRFNVLNNEGFPPANRKVPQRPADVREYLEKFKHLQSWKKFANFHLLLYLAKMIDDVSTILAICECVRKREEVPEYIESLLQNYI